MRDHTLDADRIRGEATSRALAGSDRLLSDKHKAMGRGVNRGSLSDQIKRLSGIKKKQDVDLDAAAEDYREKLDDLKKDPRNSDKKQAVADAFQKKQQARKDRNKTQDKIDRAKRDATKPKKTANQKNRAQKARDAFAADERLKKAKTQAKASEKDYLEHLKQDATVGQKESKQKDVGQSAKNRQAARDRFEKAKRELEAAKDNVRDNPHSSNPPKKYKPDPRQGVFIP